MSVRQYPALDALIRRQQELAARFDQACRRQADLLGSVGAAKARIGHQAQVRDFLETLQQREHERAVGSFERLLSAMLQDVLPGYRQAVLQLRSDKGLPALDIFQRKGPGQPLEDILHGAGGAVSNVVCAGLRIIDLLRSSHRRLLVLDEADCWIKYETAPRFASVIGQAARELGLQVLMISHHEERLFQDIASQRLTLVQDDAGLRVQASDAVDWDPAQAGLRSIVLKNCQAHKDTTFPLAPGLTLLSGANDLGKSTVNTVLRAIFYGDSNDTIVRHGAKTASAVLDFGPDGILEWRRNRQGKPVVSHRLFRRDAQGGETTEHLSEGARALPEWLGRLGVGLVDDLDVQLCHQKTPLFLLDKPATQRARALAVGSDSGRVQAMMTLDKQDLQEARATVRMGERELESLYRQINALRPGCGTQREETMARLAVARTLLAEYPASHDRACALRARWAAAVRRAEIRPAGNGPEPVRFAGPERLGARVLAQRWKTASLALAARTQCSGESPADCPPPALVPAQKLRARWVRARDMARSSRGAAGTCPVMDPGLTKNTRTGTLQKRWRTAIHHLRALALPAGQVAIDIPSARGAALAGLVQRWGLARQSMAHEQAAIGETQAALDRAQAAIAPLLCPECGQIRTGHEHDLRFSGSTT